MCPLRRAENHYHGFAVRAKERDTEVVDEATQKEGFTEGRLSVMATINIGQHESKPLVRIWIADGYKRMAVDISPDRARRFALDLLKAAGFESEGNIVKVNADFTVL